MHEKHVSSNVMKISAKYQNFVFLFVHCTNKLKALQLSKVGYRPSSSINTVKKIWHDGQKLLKPKTHEKMQIVCKLVHKRCSKCPSFARIHARRCFLHRSIAVLIMTCWKSDHRSTLLNCKFLRLLRTVNEGKVKCWYFAQCLSLHLFSWHLLDRW